MLRSAYSWSLRLLLVFIAFQFQHMHSILATFAELLRIILSVALKRRLHRIADQGPGGHLAFLSRPVFLETVAFSYGVVRRNFDLLLLSQTSTIEVYLRTPMCGLWLHCMQYKAVFPNILVHHVSLARSRSKVDKLHEITCYGFLAVGLN